MDTPTHNPGKKKHLIAVLLILVVACTGMFVFAPGSQRETLTEPLAMPSDTGGKSAVGQRTLNVAILGVGGSNHPGGHLADTVMIASIDPETAKAVLFSIPRDLYISLADGSRMRINRALAPAGKEPIDDYADRIRSVFRDAFDLHVDHFVRLDFAAFVTVVDALGGVDVHFRTPLYDEEFAGDYAVLDYAAGMHHLDGAAALHVARSRKTSTNGDFDRTSRQRAILLALKDRLESVDALATPMLLRQLLATQSRHVQTDLGIVDILRLYNVSRDMDLDDVQSLGFENSQEPLLAHASIDGAAVLVPEGGDFSQLSHYLLDAITTRLAASGT